MLAHAEVTHAVGPGSGAGRQASVGASTSCPRSSTFSTTRTEACVTTTTPASFHRRLIEKGRDLCRQDETRSMLDRELETGKGADLAIFLYTSGNDGASERRDADARQCGQGRRDRLQLRQTHGHGRDPRLSADRMGGRPYLLLRTRDSRGLLRQLPGKPGNSGRRPAGDRQHICVRATAHLREPPDPHHGADGRCERPETPNV